MIKRLETTELTTARPRTGLTHVSVLIERLMRMYDLQAEMNEKRDQAEMLEVQNKERQAILDLECLTDADMQSASPQVQSQAAQTVSQATFGWYENAM